MRLFSKIEIRDILNLKRHEIEDFSRLKHKHKELTPIIPAKNSRISAKYNINQAIYFSILASLKKLKMKNNALIRKHLFENFKNLEISTS